MCTKNFEASRFAGPNLNKFVRNIEIDDIVGKSKHQHSKDPKLIKSIPYIFRFQEAFADSMYNITIK